MMNKLALCLALLLTACGGGALQSTGPVSVDVKPGAVTCTGCTIVLGSAPVAASAASAYSAPLAVLQTPPITSAEGSLAWTAGGMTYVAAVVSNGDLSWIDVYSAPVIGTSPVKMTTVECSIDDSLDLHLPANTDEAVRAYLTATLPKIDACIKGLSGRLGNAFASLPVASASAALPSGISAVNRLAARLAQWVQITSTGATLR